MGEKVEFRLGSMSSDCCFMGSTKSEGMEATRRRVAFPHSERTAAGSGGQQSEHVAFYTFLFIKYLRVCTCFISFRKINHVVFHCVH